MIDLGLSIASLAVRYQHPGIGGLSPNLWIDPSDMRTLYQDSGGSIPVTGTGQPVGRASDQSGNDLHALQSVNSINRPTIARHPASGLRQNLNGSHDFSAFVFGGGGSGSNTLAVNTAIAPDGTQTAARVTFSADKQTFTQALSLPSGDYVGSLWIKGVAGETIRCRLSGGSEFTHTLSGSWEHISGFVSGIAPTSFNISTWASVTARVVDVWRPQHEAGSAKTPYQKRVDQYDVTEEGQRDLWYLLYDQIDDELVVDLPDLGSDSTEWWADENGIAINGSQTIGVGGRVLPGGVRLYAYGIINRTLTAPEMALVRDYLARKAGVSPT